MVATADVVTFAMAQIDLLEGSEERESAAQVLPALAVLLVAASSKRSLAMSMFTPHKTQHARCFDVLSQRRVFRLFSSARSAT
jgi:hypothetical protein